MCGTYDCTARLAEITPHLSAPVPDGKWELVDLVLDTDTDAECPRPRPRPRQALDSTGKPHHQHEFLDPYFVEGQHVTVQTVAHIPGRYLVVVSLRMKIVNSSERRCCVFFVMC